MSTHTYHTHIHWHPDNPDGNKDVRRYDRTHALSIEGKPSLHLNTDNKHVGKANLHNPEDLLLAALSSCHMLSYLYLCSLEGIVVTAYEDHAEGLMLENADGGGAFTRAVLRPVCTLQDTNQIERARALHHKAHDICYIANSVNFEVTCEPEFRTAN